MHFTIDRRAFSTALGLARQIATAPRRSVHSAKEDVTLTVDEGLTVAAASEGMSLSREIRVIVRETGACAVPADLLHHLVTSLEGDEMTVKRTRGTIILAAQGQARYTLASRSPPAPSHVDETAGSLRRRVPVDGFRILLQRVAGFAMDRDGAHPMLGGVLLRFAADQMRAYATDGQRFAFSWLPHLAGGDDLPTDRVVPAQTLVLLLKALPDDGDLEILVQRAQVAFQWPGGKLVARCLEGTYPDLERLLPQASVHAVRVSRRGLEGAMKRAMPLAEDRGGPKRLRLQINSGSLTLRARTSSLGSTWERLPAVTAGPPLRIVLDAPRVLSTLAACITDEIEMHFTDHLSQVRIMPHNGDGCTYLVMPLRPTSSEAAAPRPV